MCDVNAASPADGRDKDVARLLDAYEQARQWDAKMNEADNSGNVAGDALADAVRSLLAGEA